MVGENYRLRPGRPSREGGLIAIRDLRFGLEWVRTRQAEALVTAPVSKESFDKANFGFPGHTEWLAKVCGAPTVAMLMVAGGLRALLMTRHVPLAKVSDCLTPKVVRESARLAYDFVKRYVAPLPAPSPSRGEGGVGVRKPRLVLCGLNPHAGDHGLIGKEEQTIFLPTLRSLYKEGIPVAGPCPADSVFSQMAHDRYDLALAAYHDQGMIPLKLYAPERLVNITLGLPFIRTSPGHGTAYDIAGKSKADPRPMVEAILLAARYCR